MSLDPGTRLGPYEIVERIGAGGMGEVYRAVDTRLGREVAVKMLPSAYAHDEHRRRRLEREARAASTLNHPNIVTIHDVGSEGGRGFIVMELVQGMTLSQLIPPEGLETRLALQYALQMAGALQRAHGAGVMHRDIKPGNVMVTSDGLVKVMDFGLAKMEPQAFEGETRSRFAPDGPLTEEGAALGTFAYMSPEQARGETLDERSEIFSFGIVLYEMIAGRRPFAGNNPFSTLEAICRMEPPSLGELRTDLPLGVSRLVRRCLAKNPDERYGSFADVVDELRVLQQSPSSASVMRPFIETPLEGQPAPSAAAERSGLDLGPVSPSSPPPAPPVAPRASAESALQGYRLDTVAPARARWPWVVATIVILAAAAVGYTLLARRLGVPGADGPRSRAVAVGAYEKAAEGRALLERYDRPGNIDRAQALFEAACNEAPGYAPAFVGLAEALWRQVDRDFDKAVLGRGLDAARKAIALEEQLASAHAMLGLLLMEAGEHDQARASIDRALTLDPASRPALMGLSDLQMAGGDSAAAEATARRSVELHPDDWMAHSTLGYVLYRQSRFAEAATSFEHTLERAPDSVRTLSNLAGIYHMLGRTDDAATTLQRAIEIAPSTRAYNNLGTLRFFQGRYEESMRLFEKTVELAPNTWVHWGNLGDARRWTPSQQARAAEAYASAIALVRKHLAANPGDQEAHANLATYLVKTGQTAEALAELARARDDESADYYYTATVVHEVAGQRDQALEALDRAMELGYSPTEIEADPELIGLRRDRRFMQLTVKHQDR